MSVKKWLAILILAGMVCGILPMGACADEAENDAAYSSAIAQLNQYLQGQANTQNDIHAIKDQFGSLGNYQYSKFFAMYAEVLYNIEKGFHMANEEKLEILELYTDFADEVKKLQSKYSSLGSVEELIAYANGRRQAAAGEYAAAKQSFKNCLGFLDATEHFSYVNTYAKDDSGSSNVSVQSQVNVTVTNTAVPTLSLTAQDGGSVRLDWYYAGQAASYRVYRMRTKDEGSFTCLATVNGTTYTDRTTVRNYRYRYYIEAIDANGRAGASPFVEIVAKEYVDGNPVQSSGNPNVNNGNINKNENENKVDTDIKVDTNNENKNENNNNNRSESNSESNNEIDINNKNDTEVNVDNKVDVNVEVNLGPEWSNWSEWSTTKPQSLGSNREIEQRTTTQEVEVTKYKYTRWKYYNTNAKVTSYSYAEYRGSQYQEGSGRWESKTTTSPLSKTRTFDGHQQYEGKWYNQQTVTQKETKEVIEYRYRDRLR